MPPAAGLLPQVAPSRGLVREGEPPRVGSRSVESWRERREDRVRGCCGLGGAEVAGEPAVSKPSIFTNCADLGMLLVGCSGRAATAELLAVLAPPPMGTPSAEDVRRLVRERPREKALLLSAVRLRLRPPAALKLPGTPPSDTSLRKLTRPSPPPRLLLLRAAGLGVGKGSGGVLPSTAAVEQRPDMHGADSAVDVGLYLQAGKGGSRRRRRLSESGRGGEVTEVVLRRWQSDRDCFHAQKDASTVLQFVDILSWHPLRINPRRLLACPVLLVAHSLPAALLPPWEPLPGVGVCLPVKLPGGSHSPPPGCLRAGSAFSLCAPQLLAGC